MRPEDTSVGPVRDALAAVAAAARQLNRAVEQCGAARPAMARVAVLLPDGLAAELAAAPGGPAGRKDFASGLAVRPLGDLPGNLSPEELGLPLGSELRAVIVIGGHRGEEDAAVDILMGWRE